MIALTKTTFINSVTMIVYRAYLLDDLGKSSTERTLKPRTTRPRLPSAGPFLQSNIRRMGSRYGMGRI